MSEIESKLMALVVTHKICPMCPAVERCPQDEAARTREAMDLFGQMVKEKAAETFRAGGDIEGVPVMAPWERN